MACLSPSPSGRRLSELLEEKQEPFFLDLHLLEKGCSSSRLLDGYDTAALCWPAAGNAAAPAAAVLRRLTSKKTNPGAGNKKPKPAAGGGLLRLLLSKILSRGRAPPPPKPAARLQFSDSFKVSPAPPSPCSVKTAAAGGDAKEERYSDDGECSAYSESDDDKQQLSPVSVLDPHPFEMSSPGRRHGKVSPTRSAAMGVFRELLDAAYSPALLTHLLAKTTDDLLLLDDAAAAAGDDDDDDCYYYRSSPKNCRDDESATATAYWEAHREELARVAELVAAEVPAAKVAAGDVGPAREDVGGEVEAAVFEALVMELVADLGSSGWRC